MQLDRKSTYIAMLSNLPGVELFKHLFVVDDKGEKIDVTEDGKLSCAFVVSSILALFQLIDRPHATVGSTVEATKRAGWVETKTPVEGGLVVWPEAEGHPHIGFYIGDDKCVSNDTKLGVPSLHGLTMRDGRKPEYYLTHQSFLG